MICPHCLKTVDDSASFCPHCNAYLAAPSHDDFVFCEGCGARLTSFDRTCPKCGRPSPGILSTNSSSSDLAAGKTASFPRLTKQVIEADSSSRAGAPTAAQMLSDSIDPSATNILDAAAIDAASKAAQSVPEGEDPYHKKQRKPRRALVASLVALALVGGGAYFVAADPFGVMPGIFAWFEQAAEEMYPSRQLPQGSQAQAAPGDGEIGGGPVALTDSEVFQVLTSSHNKIVSTYDSLGSIIEDYEYGFIANDMGLRQEKSASAYGARDMLDSITRELDELDLPEGSPYGQDVENLKQLVAWVRTRVDIYCASWDISLSFADGERPADHSDEILAPLRERSLEDDEARDSYFAHVDEWRPVQKTS